MRFQIFLTLILCVPPTGLRSVDGQDNGEPQKAAQITARDNLVKRQAILARQVEQLDSKLLKLVEFETRQNPDRAKLLKQSLELSQSVELATSLNKITKLLKRGATTDLDKAVQQQKEILEDLNRLYELLESSDRLKSQRNRAKKIRSRINRLEQLIQKQKGIRQRTSEADNNDGLKEDQLRVLQQTKDLESEIGNEVDGKNKKEGDDTSADKSQPDPKPGESSKDSTNKKTGVESDEERVVNKLKSASERMQKAAGQLNPSGRQQAAQEMEAAEKDLELAKQRLEDSLRQNREEEIESTLRSLEERLGRMLQLQVKVNTETKSLTKSESPVSEMRIATFRLSGEQRKAIAEIDKALLMLTEEGSSRSIPGTLYHVKLDMQEIASQLELATIDAETIQLQKEVVDVLSELIRAVKQEQLEQNQLKNIAQQPGGGGQAMQRPLVQKIAELKIIRQLQVRINERHQSYSRALANSENKNNTKELNAKTRKLSLRQQQLEKTTLDLIQAGDQR